MPFYQFKCKECGTSHEWMGTYDKIEALVKAEACGSPQFWTPDGEDFPADGSGGCGSKSLYKVLTAPNLINANTAQWGVNGYYSKALGGYCDSPHAEEKIMNQRGFIRESDLGHKGWDDAVAAKTERMIAKEKDVRQIETDIKGGMDKGEAYAKTFSAERALSGDLDNLYGGED